MLQGVLQSAQFIASTASRVSIEDDGVRRAAEMVPVLIIQYIELTFHNSRLFATIVYCVSERSHKHPLSHWL